MLSINFISFTAQIYNTLHMQGKKGDIGILGGMAPLPPKSAYEAMPTSHKNSPTKGRSQGRRHEDFVRPI